jgi:hypothetical protein
MTTLPEKAEVVKRAEKIGEVSVTFFQDRTYKIEMSGVVTSRDVRRCQKPMSKVANRNKIARRRAAAIERNKRDEKAARIAEALRVKEEEAAAKAAKTGKSKEGD